MKPNLGAVDCVVQGLPRSRNTARQIIPSVRPSLLLGVHVVHLFAGLLPRGPRQPHHHWAPATSPGLAMFIPCSSHLLLPVKRGVWPVQEAGAAAARTCLMSPWAVKMMWLQAVIRVLDLLNIWSLARICASGQLRMEDCTPGLNGLWTRRKRAVPGARTVGARGPLVTGKQPHMPGWPSPAGSTPPTQQVLKENSAIRAPPRLNHQPIKAPACNPPG